MRKYDIPNNNYYITDEGKLFNKYTKEEFIPKPNKYGYRSLKINGERVMLHRLVATIWIPNPENKPQVDHINRIRTDNRVENLRWVTNAENQQNTTRSLPLGQRRCDLSPKEYQKMLAKRAWKKHKENPEWLKKKNENNKIATRQYYARQHGFDTWEEYQENKAKNS